MVIKKIGALLALSTVLLSYSCDIFGGDDAKKDNNDPNNENNNPTVVTDSDGDVYEDFSYDIGLYQVGWCSGWMNGDAGSDDAKVNVSLTHNTEEVHGKGSLAVNILWSNADSNSGQAYVNQYSDGGDNAEVIDGTGKTLIAKVKIPEGFYDGDDSTDPATYPGIKLYLKGSDWSEVSKWYGAWAIKDALAGLDVTSEGIYAAEEDGFVLLKAVIGTDISTANDNDSVIWESGMVFEQNGDTTLTDDMTFYIDYIDLADTATDNSGIIPDPVEDPEDPETPEVDDADSDTILYTFTDDLEGFSATYAEGFTTADITVSHDITEGNGEGAIMFTAPWEGQTAGKAFIATYPSPAVDMAGKSLVVKIQVPVGFTVGNGTDFAGINLYAKDADWTATEQWFGAWNIGDALAGNDQSANGITVDAEAGFVILTAELAVTGDLASEIGISVIQNGDDSLTNDMEFYIDYIDVIDTPVEIDDADAELTLYAFTDGVDGFSATYAEGFTTDDITVSQDVSVGNGEGALMFSAAWEGQTAGKAFIATYPSPAVDFTDSSMVVKIKVPDGFTDGNGTDFAGINLYAKDASWTATEQWFGAWNIGDALAGNDQSASGITVDAEAGFVILTADLAVTDNLASEIGIAVIQNGDDSLTDDMVFYVDYIDVQ